MNKPTQRWLITGGAGFIGSVLVRALIARGEQVTVLDDFSSSSPKSVADVKRQIRLVRGSILDEKLLKRLMKQTDIVVHLAAAASVAQSFQYPARVLQTNVQGTVNVLEYARQCGVKRVVFASSSAVYGHGGKAPRRENMLLEPLSPYAESKLLGEELCALYGRIYGINWTATRCFNIYGNGQNATSAYAAVLAAWTNQAAHNKRLIVNGDGLQTRDFLHVSDAARAILTVALKGQNGIIYNVASGKAFTLRKTLQVLEKTVGHKLKLTFKPGRQGDVRYSRADISKLSALGFTPKVTLEEGLAQLYRSQLI